MLTFSSQASNSAAFRGDAIWSAQLQHILQIRQIQDEPKIDKRHWTGSAGAFRSNFSV
jgi:hypothetical protein